MLRINEFIIRGKVQRYRSLLDRPSGGPRRRLLLALLTEQQNALAEIERDNLSQAATVDEPIHLGRCARSPCPSMFD